MDIEQLAARIKQASDRYYNAEPIMTDEDYDQLVEQLRSVAPDHQVLATIGAPVGDNLEKMAHPKPVGSLEKIKTFDELKSWCEQDI